MASVTLAESAKLAQDDLVAGVIENVITVNRMFEVLPFDGIDGNALAYNRENALGDVDTEGVGDTIGAKAAATFSQVTSSLTTIIGDAEVNGLIQATRSGDGNNQKAVQIASKAKSAGRKYQDMLINGDSGSVATEFDGLLAILAAADASRSIIQDTAGVTTNGGTLSFEKLDELFDLIVDKDGEVDYATMHASMVRKYRSLLRALGGASINEVVQLPSGAEVPGYSGVPLFRNDWIPTDQTQGSLMTATTIFAGTLDDGSRSSGIAGLTAASAAGIQVVEVGESETKDESITRVKWYCGLANFSEKGVAQLSGISVVA
jgi:hypothetical protein